MYPIFTHDYFGFKMNKILVIFNYKIFNLCISILYFEMVK